LPRSTGGAGFTRFTRRCPLRCGCRGRRRRRWNSHRWGARLPAGEVNGQPGGEGSGHDREERPRRPRAGQERPSPARTGRGSHHGRIIECGYPAEVARRALSAWKGWIAGLPHRSLDHGSILIRERSGRQRIDDSHCSTSCRCSRLKCLRQKRSRRKHRVPVRLPVRHPR